MRFQRLSAGVSKSVLMGTLGLAFGLGASRVTAQTITFPQPNAQVRGSVKALFEGVPEGGYAIIYLDGKGLSNLREATTQPFHILNTFALPDGKHTLTVVAFNAAGKRIGQAEVRFEVANNSVDATAEAVRLINWTNKDLTEDVVRRYRIFAESNATIEGGATASSGGGGGGGEAEGAWIPAPLDFQIDLLVRRVVRDVGLFGNSANVRSVVQEAYFHQRDETLPAPEFPRKAPWNSSWFVSPDSGRYAVKTIKQNGDEINATRKPATLGLADLLPRFPAGTVQPGSTWESEMTLVAEIPQSTGVNVRAPMTFVAFENVQTPAGQERRTAKMESRFNLPLEAATKIARSIQKQAGALSGSAGGGAAAPVAAGPGGPGVAEVLPPDFKVVRVSVTREIWFDIAGNQVLRSNDVVNTFYEEEPLKAAGGRRGAPAAEAGGVATEPVKVSYDLRVTKYLDDTIPPPSDSFNAGAGTAHSRDRVQDPSISRILRGR
ncbi:MAG TPA: hypothetical protein VF681_01055 [Abditibacteriaceae bacterium]|jgi:hypothetical protein